jgi:hypothetical protein
VIHICKIGEFEDASASLEHRKSLVMFRSKGEHLATGIREEIGPTIWIEFHRIPGLVQVGIPMAIGK